MNIIFSEERMPGKPVIEQMMKAAELCVVNEGIDPERVEISVTFVSTEEIRELNNVYRGKDNITDVLSFPQFDDFDNLPPKGTLCIGDVVICPEQALLQADEFGHSGERELVYLFVHSVFHLLGYDHMEDDEKIEMRELEEQIMLKIGLLR